ncbi:flagellar FlbD family protein [Oceanobacillus luteolus]|uniref:Flagellar FlbD family protein n=1 Tax=Oceanobacillus luteolus TaxID=1274358 RepID=A0ABW4HRL8_9BACI|nr:flagellar FlbD family protein [Oceanobacillus luteolus]MCM3739040.1 flagellar FlbD family protein [Oceanobacillus luteolus]
MIQLKKLNGDLFSLNALLIEQVQAMPDTTITLINGKKVIVQNPPEEVLVLIQNYYKEIGLQQVYKQVGDQNE